MACSWKNVFYDLESEIHYYEWGIGSNPGYDDIMNYTRAELECGENNEVRKLSFKEGHAYYISVKVILMHIIAWCVDFFYIQKAFEFQTALFHRFFYTNLEFRKYVILFNSIPLHITGFVGF